MTIEEIIRQCQRGKPKAQRMLYDRFATPMFRLCFRYLKETQAAEDAMIRGFLKVLKNIGSFEFRSENGTIAWIKRIMVNEALMDLRKQHNFHLREESTEEPAEAAQVLEDLDAEHIYELIRQLPAGYRTVFNLHVVEGYSHPEIAEMLHISENTSKSQLSKARKALQRQLQHIPS